MDMRISPSALSGTIRIPGSKSHTIRSLLLSLLSEGQSVITGALTSGDGAAAINAARSFGAAVIEEGDTLTITGVGGNLIAPKTIIDTANSGTTTTLFSSVAALSEGFTIITGDEQIRRRSIAPLIEALNGLGAHAFFTHPSRTAPPVVIGGTLGGGRVTVDGSNSQVVSSLLLACPLAAGDSEITVTNALETPYVRLTLDWMERYGVRVDHDGSYTHYTVKGGQSYRAGDHTIAADWSSAAFPLVAGAITPSRLTIEGWTSSMPRATAPSSPTSACLEPTSSQTPSGAPSPYREANRSQAATPSTSAPPPTCCRPWRCWPPRRRGPPASPT